MTHQLTPAQQDAIHYITTREGIAPIDDCKQVGIRITTLRALARRGMVHVSDTVVVLLTEGSDGEPVTLFRPVIDGCDCYQDAFDRWAADPYTYPYPSETDVCKHVGEATSDYQEAMSAAQRLGVEYGADTVTVEVARYWAAVRVWDVLTTVTVVGVEGEPAADDADDVDDATEPATVTETAPATVTEPADVEGTEVPATVVKPKGLTPAQKRVIDYLDTVGGSAPYSEVLGSTRVKCATLRALENRELITTDGTTVTRINPTPTTADLTDPQQRVYEVLRYHGPATVSELRDHGITRATVDALESQGMVVVSGDTVRLATTIGVGTWVEAIINGLRLVCQVWAFAVGGLWVVDAHQRAHKVAVSEVAVVGTGSPAEQPALFGESETEGETVAGTPEPAAPEPVAGSVSAAPVAEPAPAAVESAPTAPAPATPAPTAVESAPATEFRGTPIPDLPGVMTLDATVTVPSGDQYAPPTYTYPATGTPVRVFITLGPGGDPVYEYGTVLGVTEDRTPYGLVAVRYERGVIDKVGPYSVSPADRDVTPATESAPATTEPAPTATTPTTPATETGRGEQPTPTDPGMYRVTRRNGVVLYGGNLPATAVQDARDRHTVIPITHLDTIVVDGGDTTTLPTTCRELWQTARDTGTTWEINAWQENGRPVVRLSLMLPVRDRYIRFIWVNGRLNSQRSGMSVRDAKRHMTGGNPTPATTTPTTVESAPATPAPTATPAPKPRYLTRYGKTWDRNGVIATQARDPHGDVWAVAYNRDTRQVTVRHRDSGWTAKRVVTRVEDVNPVAEELAKARTTPAPTTPATTEPAAETRATTPRQWRHLGTTTDVTTCECCGRTDLTRTVIIVAIDADGTPHGEPTHYGTTCAARALGTTTADVRASAAAADRRKRETVEVARLFYAKYPPHLDDTTNATAYAANNRITNPLQAFLDYMRHVQAVEHALAEYGLTTTDVREAVTA